MNKYVTRGDTIIEVVLSISIFSMLMVGGLALMNSGLARSQGTLQLTMARNAIDAQAESLRYINNAFIAQYPNVAEGSLAQKWTQVTSQTSATASDLSQCRTNFGASNVFIIDTLSMSKVRSGMNSAVTFPRLVFNTTTTDTNRITDKTSYIRSEGIWIEAIKPATSTSSNRGYYDFHIRACWMAAGSNVPTTLGTIVRLYDPRG